MVQTSAETKIRKALPGDAAGVRACLAEAFEPYRERYTAGAFQNTVMTAADAEERLRDWSVLVAEDDSGQVVGTVSYRVEAPGHGHLRGMAVLPRFQGQDVAERLLGEAEKDLLGQGCSRVTLDTTLPLERAVRFYRRNGYVASGVITDFFGMELHQYEKKCTSTNGIAPA